MKAIFVVSVVIMTACAVSGNPVKRSSDPYSGLLGQKGEVSYEPVGCFDLKNVQEEKFFGEDDYKNTKDTSKTSLDQCVAEAEENNYGIIGIQKIRKKIICRKGDEQKWNAAMSGEHGSMPIRRNCKNQVGSKENIYVYKSKNWNPDGNETCSFGDKLYEAGEIAEFYNKTFDGCDNCKCSHGQLQYCHMEHWCHTAQKHCVELIHRPGDCCPTCKPFKCNGRKKNEWWYSYVNNTCLRCECHDGINAICRKGFFYGCPTVACADPVIREGTCCPYCENDKGDNLNGNFGIVGCYNFEQVKILYKRDFLWYLDPSDTATAIEHCIEEAKSSNFSIFGIQKKEKKFICTELDEQIWKRNPDWPKKKNPKKCKGNVGSKKFIAIYQKGYGDPAPKPTTPTTEYSFTIDPAEVSTTSTPITHSPPDKQGRH